MSAWTNPWLIGIGVGFMLIGLPMVLWLMTYHSDIAVKMFVITWLSLTGFVLLMTKQSLNDPRFYVDRKVLKKTKHELENQGTKAQVQFLKNEIEILNRGEKTPVFDVWRLDQALSKRHLFFPSMEASLLDPQAREIHFKIQITDARNADGSLSISEKILLNHIAEFFKTIVRDPYLMILRKFFDRIVLQIDALREDEHRVDRPFPILSLMVEYTQLEKMTQLAIFDGQHLSQGLELRFDGGNEIEPHREIESVSTHGSK
jgi:hypothetical protein